MRITGVYVYIVNIQKKWISWPLVPALYGKQTNQKKVREKLATMTDFLFMGSKITVDSDRSHEIKRLFSLEEKLWQH